MDVYNIILLQKTTKKGENRTEISFEINKEEYGKLRIWEIRTKIFKLFFSMGINLKYSESEYQLILPNGKFMKLTNVFLDYFKNNNPEIQSSKHIYFSCMQGSIVIEVEKARILHENERIDISKNYIL